MKHVTDKDIHAAYLIAAKIVAKYGDKYLPIFERMEKEYKKSVEKNNVLKRAITIAESLNISDQN